jgi:hypothetical protein
MLLTEKEARGLICWRFIENDRHAPVYCEADYCPAWRWGEDKYYAKAHPSEKLEQRSENRRGYCGLAGKPEFE